MPTVAQFLMDRIQPLSKDIFGVAGDYCLNLVHQLNNKFKFVNTCDEQGAGFAADAYARCNGFGVVVATYCVGGFKLLNPIAGAYAERSPVLFISGAPGVAERKNGLLLHHAAGAYECQHQVFKNVTCASAVLDDPQWAGYEIERVIDSIKYYNQPGYIEIPRDMVDRNIVHDAYMQDIPMIAKEDDENLKEALEVATHWLSVSKNPIILAGVEIARFGFGEELKKFAERNNILIATTILGKSTVNERHPLSIGIYNSKISDEQTCRIVEEADCVLMLGVMQTDLNFGFQPFACDRKNVIMANTGRVKIRRSTYENVRFQTFVKNLLKIGLPAPKSTAKINHPVMVPFKPESHKPITVNRVFEKIDSFLDKTMAIVADIGDSLFGAVKLTVHHRNHFLAPAFYTSMGSSIPGALGLQTALPNVRPIVIVGDGAFQMTGNEISTIIRQKLNPIIFILNNGGYVTERRLGYDGSYNDLQNWNYHEIPKLYNGGVGFLVKTEEDLELAVRESLLNKNSVSVINVIIDKNDITPALRKMTEKLSESI